MTMRTLSYPCARHLLSLSVAAALMAPMMTRAAPIVADGVHVDVSDATAESNPVDWNHGLSAVNGGTISATGVTASGVGNNSSYGVHAEGEGSHIDFAGGSVSASGNASHGVGVRSGGSAAIKGAVISTTGQSGAGLSATYSGSTITFSDVEVSTSGYASHAIQARGAQITGIGARINTSNEFSDGAFSVEGGDFSGTQLNIHTTGNTSRGVATGDAGSKLAISESRIVTEGTNSHGARARDGAVLEMRDTNVATHGMGSKGVDLEGGIAVIEGSSFETAGHGLDVWKAGNASVANSTFTTHGEAAHGLEARTGAQLNVADTLVFTQGTGANAARASGGATIALAGSALRADAAAALHLDNGTLTATDGSTIEGNGTVVEFGSDVANTLSFDRDVVALGDMRFADGALDSDANGVLDRTSALLLDNNSYWKGATDAIGDLSLANGSRWDITGNSEVGTLSLVGGSVVFDHSDGQYKTLTVEGNFHADNGLLAMNTDLGDDSSPTDLLHVMGDTSGNAQIAVNNIGGTGAQTEDGIKLVQVDGMSAGEYALAGRAVGGAYEYFLYQGGHTDPNDGDWYLRSELSNVDPVIDPPKPPSVFRAEGGAYLSNQASALGLFNMDLHERVGEPNLAQRQRGDGSLGSAWARITTEQPRYRVNDQLVGQGRQNAVQVGSDLTFWGSQDRGVVGVMAASGQATHRITSELTGYGAEGRVDGRALGVYGTWMQDAEDDDGLYIDGWVQAARFKNRVQGDALAREQYRSSALSASLEAGYAVRLHQTDNSGLYLEPQAQVIWTDYRMNGGQHQEVNGTIVKGAEAGGVQTRIGARLYGHSTAATGNRVQPFMAVNWIRNGRDANAVWMGDQQLQGIVSKDVYEAKVGAQLQLSPRLTGWGELSTQRGDDGFRSVGGQMGVKYAW
ncbi:autotransporter family protein [Stenotrophomonas sp. Ker107b]